MDDESRQPPAQRGTRRAWARTAAWSTATLAIGAGTGVVSGLVWLREAQRSHDFCAVQDAVNPESYCGLGYGLFTLPVMVVVAAFLVTLLLWLLLTLGGLRPRAAIVVLAPVLTLAAGGGFEYLGRFDALDDPAPWRVWVPTVVLGAGLAAGSMLARLHRRDEHDRESAR
ncbi:hypothetical protein [Actinocatenispora thailandica]|uniref:hypothetical protein n=1 Tax=Actinocatenispora thailandica TaxID=227318 RepID=UPI0031DEBFD4